MVLPIGRLVRLPAVAHPLAGTCKRCRHGTHLAMGAFPAGRPRRDCLVRQLSATRIEVVLATAGRYAKLAWESAIETDAAGSAPLLAREDALYTVV